MHTKYIVFILLGILLTTLSCRKQKLSDTIYPQFVGVWRNANGHYSPEIEFTSNGCVVYSLEGERGNIVKVKEIRFLEPITLNDYSWSAIEMGTERREYFEKITILFKENEIDTILVEGIKFIKK